MTVVKQEYGVREAVVAYLRGGQRKDQGGWYIVFFHPLLIFTRQVYTKIL